jgi:hypothetical protein
VLPGKNGSAKTPISANPASSLRGSPKPPSNVTENNERDLNALISEFSVPQPNPASSLPEAKSTENPASSSNPKMPSRSSSSTTTRALSLGSPKTVSKPASNGIVAKTNGVDTAVVSNGRGRNIRSRSVSEISEGEIVEDAPPEKPPPKDSNESLPAPNNTDREAVNGWAQEEQISKSIPSRPSHQEATSNRVDLPTQPRSQRLNEHRDEPALQERIHQPNQQPERRVDNENERDTYSRRGKATPESKYRTGQRVYPESEREHYPSRKQSRDEGFSKPQQSLVLRKEPEQSMVVRQEEPAPPRTLVPGPGPEDQDVREWLIVTGFHNVEYRTKVLERRRKLAALDEERRQLIEEIAIEERGAIAPTPIQASMMPPPTQNKIEMARTNGQILPSTTGPIQSNKRSHSDVGDSPKQISVKVARTNERVQETGYRHLPKIFFRSP